MMQEIVESEEAVCIPIEELNTDVDKSFRAIKSDILIILGGFADTENLETALDLFFEFYRKRPDLFSECYHAITTYYSISRHSYKYGFYTPIKLMEKFKAYSCNWTNGFVTLLFLAVAPKLLEEVCHPYCHPYKEWHDTTGIERGQPKAPLTTAASCSGLLYFTLA